MNIIFLVIFVSGSILMIIFSPEEFFPAMLSAGEKAAMLCVTLLSSYCIWMGFMQVLTDCSLTDKISKKLTPLAKKLFKTDDKAALEAITMNLSANILGLSGIATPYGIQAVSLTEGKPNAYYSQAMLFVISATSLQILPTTVISLLSSYGSANPYDIILPSFITTAFSTALGIALTKLFVRPDKGRRIKNNRKS